MKRGKGRPPTPEAQQQRRVEMAQRMLDEELATTPLRKVAIGRAAKRLKVSGRTLERWLATEDSPVLRSPVLRRMLDRLRAGRSGLSLQERLRARTCRRRSIIWTATSRNA